MRGFILFVLLMLFSAMGARTQTSGTLAVVSQTLSGGVCTHTSDTGDFAIGSGTLDLNLTNASIAAGSYYACVQATKTGIPTKYQEVAITVTGGGSSVALVRTFTAHGGGPYGGSFSNDGNNVLTWNMGTSIAPGDAIVAYSHSSGTCDCYLIYPASIHDNLGHTYTLSNRAEWVPFTEGIVFFMLANIQGSPTSLTFDFSAYPPSGQAGMLTFNDIGIAEYSGASRFTISQPYLSYSTQPSTTITPSGSALIWGFASNYECAEAGCNVPTTENPIENSGYSLIINNYPTDDMGVWGTNSTVTGTQTLIWPNPQANPSWVCNALAGQSNGCPAVVGAVAVQ